MIGTSATDLLARRRANISTYGRPLPGDILAPTPGDQTIWPALPTALWALRTGRHRTGIDGTRVISYTGMAVHTGRTEQWYRLLNQRDALPPPRWVMQFSSRVSIPFWPREEMLRWLAQHGKLATISA
jgi:hypothetical protein